MINMTGKMRVHGSIGVIGPGAEVTNLNLEIKTNHDDKESLGNIWINGISKRIEYAESATDTNDIRQLATDLDISDVKNSIALLKIGSATQAWGAQLDALSSLNVAGNIVRTGANTFVARALIAPSSGIVVNNGNGVNGNPTLALSNDLNALENLASTGIAVRTAVDTWVQRVIAVQPRLVVVNGDCINGNPTFDLASGIVAPGTYQSVTVDTYGRVIAGTTLASVSDTVRQRIRKIVGVSTGSNTIIPYDNTVPTVTEGAQIWSQAITPKNAGSTININFSSIVDASKINIAITIAVFRNTQLIGFVTAGSSGYNGALPEPFTIDINDPASGTTEIVYSARIGVSANSTWYLGRGASFNQGGSNNMHVTITEEQ